MHELAMGAAPMPSETWISLDALLGALIGAAAAIVTAILVLRDERKKRSEQWKREQETRFHHQRRETYSAFAGAAAVVANRILAVRRYPSEAPKHLQAMIQGFGDLGDAYQRITFIANTEVALAAEQVRKCLVRAARQGSADFLAEYIQAVGSFTAAGRKQLELDADLTQILEQLQQEQGPETPDEEVVADGREAFPRGHLSQTVTRTALADGWQLFQVALRVQNKGEVLIELKSAEVRLHQLVPAPESLVDALEAGEAPVKTEGGEIDWPILDSHRSEWQEGVVEIEPGESDEFHADFVIGADVATVQTYAYVENKAKEPKDIGWPLQRIYDLNGVGAVIPVVKPLGEEDAREEATATETDD